MKPVEIERLLQWTFCDQMSKRAAGPQGPKSAWGLVEAQLRMGCRVQSSRTVGDVGDIHSFPESDAFIVVREVDQLNTNVLVDWSESKATLLDNLWAISPEEQLLAFNEVELVVEFAQTKSRPVWNVGQPKPLQVTLANGKAAVSGRRYGKDRYSDGANCPLRWAQPTVESVAFVRARYAVWQAALSRLALALDGKLKNIVVLPPSSPASPWITAAQPRG